MCIYLIKIDIVILVIWNASVRNVHERATHREEEKKMKL